MAALHRRDDTAADHEELSAAAGLERQRDRRSWTGWKRTGWCAARPSGRPAHRACGADPAGQRRFEILGRRARGRVDELLGAGDARDLDALRDILRRALPKGGGHDRDGRADAPNISCGTSRTGHRHDPPDRPERKNPLTFDSYAELRDTFRALPYADDVDVVILAPNGGNFCSGGDVHDIIGPLTAWT
jgi:hypothetical protein